MNRPRTYASHALLIVVLLAAVASTARADQWISYIGGGVDRVGEGDWAVRKGQVLFKQLGGTLVSVPARDVDLATSTLLTWQLNGRRGTPPRVALAAADSADEAPPCVPARVAALPGSESLEVITGGKPEIVHIACLDSPETDHRLDQVAWFGRAAHGWLELLVRPGDEICLTEESPAQVDGEGHRIVHVKTAEGRDYAAAAIGAGYGLLRAGACSRAFEYRSLEDQAIARERGLWGAKAEKAAVAAVSHSGAAASGPPPRRRGGGGG